MKLDQLKIITRNRFEVLSVPDQDEFEGSSEDEKLESVQMEEKSQTNKYDVHFEEQLISEDEIIENVSLKETTKKQQIATKSYTRKEREKRRSVSLNKFEMFNQFDVLEENPEEINQMKKGCLKKCRNCNHKKQSCLEDRSNCNAFQRICFGCKKIGHFPRSLNCKKNKK